MFSIIPSYHLFDFLFRQAVYIPYLDNVTSQLLHRFQPLDQQCIQLQYILPAFLEQGSFGDIREAIKFYDDDIDTSILVIKAEYDRWRNKWSNVSLTQRPANALDTLTVCDSLCFPNIHTLLRLFATLPVTTASSERTFSTLRRLLTYLRSTMGQERLNGLTHLTANRDINIDIDSVINELSKKKRRLDFV